MIENLQVHIQKIKQFNKDRITWLRLSGFVIIAIFLTIIDWMFINNQNFNWLLISSGLLLSAIWWYWTMKLVRELLNHKTTEIEILSEIILDIKEIKKDIKNIDQNS